jgi:hypothetical protein
VWVGIGRQDSAVHIPFDFFLFFPASANSSWFGTQRPRKKQNSVENIILRFGTKSYMYKKSLFPSRLCQARAGRPIGAGTPVGRAEGALDGSKAQVAVEQVARLCLSAPLRETFLPLV